MSRFTNDQFLHFPDVGDDVLSLFQSSGSLKFPLDDWVQPEPLQAVPDAAAGLVNSMQQTHFDGIGLPVARLEALQPVFCPRQSQTGTNHTLGSATTAGGLQISSLKPEALGSTAPRPSGFAPSSSLATANGPTGHLHPRGLVASAAPPTPSSNADDAVTDADADTQDHCVAPCEPPPAPPPRKKSRKKPVVELSTISDPAEYRRQKKLQKNRRTAAESRQRKRQQMDDMFERMKRLEGQLADLSGLIADKDNTIRQLQAELEKRARGSGPGSMSTRRPHQAVDACRMPPAERTVFFSAALAMYVLAWKQCRKRELEQCLLWPVLNHDRFKLPREQLQRLLHELPEDTSATHLSHIKSQMQRLPPEEAATIWANARQILHRLQPVKLDACGVKREPCTDESKDPIDPGGWLPGFPVDPWLQTHTGLLPWDC